VIRVLAAASSAIARAGLESLLQGETGVVVVAAAGDLARLETLVEQHHPEAAVVLIEATDPDPPANVVALASGGLPVILLTPEAPLWAADALRAGVRAMLPRQATGPEILAALQAALAGLVVLHPNDVADILSPHTDERVAPISGADTLTPRESGVLRMLAEGLGNKAIAYQLGISEHTVKFHVASLMGKLGAQSRTEAVTIGLRRGLIML
jgi:NarL family two-component system response regulator YdfI